MSTSVILAIACALIFLVPLLLYIFADYEPASFGESARQAFILSIGTIVVWMVINFLSFGRSFENWTWGYAVGMIAAVTLKLASDWVILRREQGKSR